VRPGIEILLTDSLHLIAGHRVGLLTNQTGIDRSATSDVDLLLAAGIQLTAIFSPEHGFRGRLEQEEIAHAIDSATGVPIYSLYGTHRAPTQEMLQEVDVLLVDLQDIGARPYTYISTALGSLRVAAEHALPVVVLDRPNPIGGVAVQGPVLDTSVASFVGMLPVSLRHGMTLGELALFGNDYLEMRARLVVVPAAGWRRDQWFDQTGLPWVRPSPNMPDLESATHYPGLVLFEGTNLSVGRGTAIAFQVVGAPWLDVARVLREIGAVPGVSLSPDTLTPREPGDRKFPEMPIAAVRLAATDRDVYDPTRLAGQLLWAIRRVHADSFRITSPAYFDARAGTDRLRRGLEAGSPLAELWSGWEAELAAFRAIRLRYLLYD
jgi:uncharacterized protein YbbC (DUF1343 family)